MTCSLPRNQLEWVVIDCPYCGESYETGVDLSAGAGVHVEDCAVCCRPIVVHTDIDLAEDQVRIHVRREQD